MIDQHLALQKFAARLTARSVLTTSERNAILALKTEVRIIAAHRDIVRFGERVDYSCLVGEGLVGRYAEGLDGRRQITGLCFPGDMADLSSVVSPNSAWGLTSLNRTTIFRVPHVQLRKLAATHPGVAEALWRDCVADGSIFSEWVMNVGRRDAMSRTAHLLCELAIRSERAEVGNRTSYALQMTQGAFADATGLTAVHVNRTLKQLRDLSVASFNRGRATVYNWDRLVAIGDFDPGYMLLDGPGPRIVQPA